MSLQNIEAIYPLSPFQASQLSGNLRALDRSAYCGQMICSLHGQLDTEAFERAWRLIIDQHPILRTAFAWENLEKPVQLVHRQIDFSLLLHDWRGFSLEQQHELLDSLLEAERETGFHATQAPLMRLCLCRLSNDDYCLLWSYDLLVLDNWSLPLLLEKAIAVYDGQLKGEIPQVEQGRLYQDYIAWLTQQDLTQAEAFWKESLNGLNGSDNLNGLFQHSPLAHETTNGYAHIEMTSGLTASLRVLASEHQLDFQALVQGAWALLLSRYSGENEIVYGATVSGRPADLTGASLMIGPFSNVLPVHVRVSSSTPVVSWLKSLSAHLDDLRRYSFYPVTRWSRDNVGVSELPTFVSTVQIESSPSNGILHENGASLHVRQIQTVEQTKSPLMLIAPSQSEATLQLGYNPAALDDASAARLTQHFENLLTGILQQPQLPISQLSILSAPELDQLLYSFNDTAGPLPQTSIHAHFQQQVLQSPDAVALGFEGTTLTYRELNERANQLAHYLQRSGVSPDVLVGILMHRSVEMLVAVLGILKAGGAYVPLDPSYPRERLAFMVRDARLRMLLTQEELLNEVPGEYVGQTLSLNQQWDAIAGESVENLLSVAHPESLAYVIYTSGSTGRPKGVLISHENVVRLLEATQPHFEFNQNDVWTLFHSYAFDFSVWEIWGALAYGGKLVIVPYWISRSAEAFHRLLVSEQVTVLNQTPSAFRQLMAADESAGDGVELKLRLVIFGGEALELQSLRPWFARHGDYTPRLVNMFGITETTVHVTYRPLTAADLELASSSVIGRPLECLQVYLLDGRGQPVPIGVPGEICVGGTGLARGYLNRAELTAERFVPHPFSSLPGARLYRSGDLARFLPNGDIDYLGRIDQQVKVRGFRIELGEIEAVLAGHEGVREAVVLVREDERGDKRLAAYVVKEVESEVTAGELKEYLRERLPEYMQVQWVVPVAELPLTANGKIDRRALQARQVELEAGGASVLARTPAEEIVAAIWAEVLGRETVSVHDNFFELGGHSLLATQVISRVRDAFRQEVALRSLFERPTVAGLVQSIEQQQRAGAGLLAPPLVRIRGAKRLPLSFAQQRLWFLDQLEPGSSFYNIPAAVRLRGVLNVAALERTLSEVVRRHEVLRTHFIAIDGEPVQVIEAAAPLQLEVLELSALEEEVREAEVLRLAQREASQPFDLWRGPLLRVGLLRLGKEEHVALVTMHHIVSDGWSMGLFIDEVATLYAAYVRGDESPLEELPIQYADFAHWQRGWLQGEVLAAQLDYWRAELADAPTVIDLPIDKPRPPVQTYRGAFHSVQLSTELSAQLRELSRRHGSTLFMTLLAAFDVLMCRYAGQEQVLVGSPIANRNRSETEGLIGFFVNTLVLRGDVRGNPSFRELLRRMRETALSAYAHQDLPFEKLVEELQPERDMSRSPLFQVTFTWQNAPSEALELEGLSLSGMESTADTVKYEVSLVLEERGGAIVGAMAYNRDLFEATTIKRLVESYERVLQAVVTDAEQRVLEIDLLSETERQQIVEGWNETRREYRGAVTLHRLFEAQAARSGEAVALVFEGEQLSYAELDRRSNQLAHHLVSLGVSPDSLVAVCLDRSLELFVALLAILKAGAAYLPLDPSYPLARLSFMLADAGSPLLLTTEALADELPTQWTPPVLLDADWDLIALNPDEPLPETVVAAEQLAYVMYTSGSTGTPKGVAVTHGGVVRLVTSPNYVRLNADQTLLQLAPLTFDASTLEVWGALLNGGRLVVMPPSAPTLDEISRVIVDEGVTTLWLTAGLFHLMVDEQLEGLSQVEQLLAGGDVLSVHHVEKYLAKIDGSERRLINGYGPTENTTFTCCHVMDGQTRLNGSVPIGRPITNTQVYVLDAEMQIVPVGVVGELYIGGVGLARGYFNQPELTAERFVPHPHGTVAGERLYRTGDMVRWHESGELEFIGRVDGQVKIRGFRIEGGEIEAVLAAHAGVREAVVLVREDERGDKRLAAYVVQEAESEVSAGELKEYLRERLPEYMQVQWVVAVAELPLTANGKVDWRALQALEVESSSNEIVLARTPAEEILAAIWAEVLGRETIGVHDNFFDLGGHSLLATQVISRVRDAFGQEVALRSLFEQPTVAGLAREIEARRGLGLELQAPPLERVERAERLPLSFAQQRLWFLDQLEPGSSFYNIPAAVRLRGVLNVGALERTLSEVVRRHEALRTHFIAIDGEPVQVIEAAAPLQLEVLDLSALDEAERTAETERLVNEESGRPFDLASGPLLRVGLLRLGKEEHVALVTMHHIVSDGWSMGLFIDEVATLYKVFTAGEESPLEELPIQYADFAHWQRGWLQGEVLAAQLDYWRAELADAPTVIDLPSDKPRPPIQTYRGANQPLQLSAELSAQLRDLSRRHGSTLFMTLLAAFDLLLCRYAGQEQVLVGTPIANRNRLETEGLIGFFVNTLVLRGDVRGNPSFSELLRGVRETALSAYAHQDLPFEKLVEELQPERDMSRSPLFQVMFALQNAPGEALELPDLTLSSISTGSSAAKFDLGLTLQEVEGCITGEMDYNVDLFEGTTIERLSEHFKTLLQSIVANFERPVAELRLLSEAEERQLLYEWNDQPAPVPELYSDCYHRLFEAQVEHTPDALAAVLDSEQLTYEELNSRANQLAHYFQTLGIGPEVPVGMLLERSLDMIVALLAIFKAGGVFVPLDTQQPAERQQYFVADARIAVLLTHTRFKDVLPEAVRVVYLDLEQEKIAAQSTANVAGMVDPANLAYVIYTSGSTGRPKGVAVSHEGIVSHCLDIQEQYKLRPGDRMLVFASLTFDMSLEEILPTLLFGASLVMRSGPVWTTNEFVQALAKYEISIFMLSTAYWHRLTQDSIDELTSSFNVRLVALGGEAALPETVRLWQSTPMRDVPLINTYGPTETIISATALDVIAPWPDTFQLPTVPIGRPLMRRTAYILDAHYNPTPVGVPGELHIGGPVIARGYLHRPELTAEKFIPDMFSDQPGGRLYRTGDVARYLPDGNIEFLGRADHQVKIRGFRVELGEIEAALKQHASVKEAVVLYQNERLIAYAQLRMEGEVGASELRAYLKERLPEYMTPAVFVEVAEFALTPNGKLNRRALPAVETISVQEGEYAAPRTPTEELLSGLWASVLRVSRVGINDNFFELGGHSLLATQLVSRVRDAFGVELPLRELFERPTVAGLAEQVEAAQGGGVRLTAPPLVPVSREQQLPLSFAQQRLWFLDQLEPGSSFYNIPAAVRLRGVLNVAALERTLSEVVRRHEALRTHFIAIDGEPVQVIEAAAPLQLEVLDLSALDEAERTAETERLVNEESGRPFDLASGPLLRVGLLRLGKEEHVALVTMHHIVSDGWSMGLFIDEVATLYAAYVRGDESPLEELPIQYADFAHWQRGWLQGEVLAAQLDYWRAELADAPTVIELPSDKPRPPIQTYRGAYQPLQLSAELSAQLRDLSRQNGSTLFMTLLAAFDLLLCRYAGQEQVLVGTPIANRNRSETEGLIGFFVNTLVLRGDVRGNPSFSELLRRVRETALSAYAHQDLPFEKLVEELQPERDMSRSPLFQVMFVLQNAPGEALELEGLSLGRVGSAVETAKFELLLGLQEVGEEVAGSINYNRDLYEAETIGRLAASYERVLQAVVTDAEQRAWEIDLLSDAERQQVIQGWNATAREYAPALTLSELFEAQAARTPETVALGFEGTTLTYRELNERANQLARYLQCSGVGPDVLVGILMHRSVEMLVAVLGILKAGGAYVPLDPSYPGERLAFMVRDAGLRMLLTQEELLNEVPGEYVGQTLSLNQQWDAIAGESSANLPSSAQPEHVAYVIYTSGSTGRPKGVVVSHENVVRLLEATQPHFEFNQNDVWTLFHSYAFDFSVWEIWGALAYGGKLVIVPYWISRSAEAFHRLLVSEQVTVLNQTPSAFRQLMAADELAGDGVELKLRLVIFGGEALELQSLRPWFARHGDYTPRLVNMFGITETTVHVTYRPLTAADLELASSSVIGRPLECLQVYLLDGRGQPVPIGVPGEICVGGTGLARGYLNRAELTAERFVPNPFSTSPGARLYRSGDLARFLPNGDIDYLGRIDQQVKVRGFRIELGEIEAALAEHEAVRECTVIAAAGANGETKLLAYLVARRQQPTPSVTALREFLQEKLPEYMIPASFTMLDAMPLTTNGKIDRRALPAPDAMSLVLGSGFLAPRTPVEEIVASIWSQLLDVERIGIADNFFELGGHSLLATQVISRVRDAFGQEVALRSLFEQPTVAGLAQTIERAQRAGVGLSAPPLVPISRDAELPLSFAQQRLWFLDQMGPGSVAYNIPAGVRLKGRLDVEALQRTLDEVVRRHEVLRTTFVAVDGEPRQVIKPFTPVVLPVFDVSEMDATEREAETRRLLSEEASQPFDLARGPLVRACLVRLQADEHVALVTMHHIVSDGWSIGVLVREVAALYSAYVRGEESPLEELPIQYADFAHWQRRWLQGEVLDAQLDYWRAELADAPTVIDVPIDKPRPPVQTYRGAFHSVQLSTELSAQLRELSRRHGSTLFMTLLAAFDVLMCRYAGQEQVLVGSPIANRNRSETEGLIGFFVNTLVLRGDVRGNPSFRELLLRVRETALSAYAHQDLPFEKLVEELQPERDMSRSPLFQVMFVLQNAPSEALELEGLRLSGVEGAADTVKFEMSLVLEERGGAIVGAMAYNPDLFEATTIERLVASYERVLQAISANADQRVLEIDLLSETERQQIVEGWNETRREYRGAVTLHRLFEAQAARSGEAVALVFEGEQLSYAELDRRSNQLAHHLVALGVCPESLVAVCLDRSLELFIALLGILKAGAAYLPLDLSYPLARLSFMLADAGSPLVLTSESLADELPTQWTPPVLLDADWDLIALNPDEALPETAVGAEQLAYVMYTSGSTGTPKGVAVTHGGVVRLVRSPNYVRLDPDQTLLQLAPLTFDASTLEVWGALLNGGRLVVMPPSAPTLDEISRVIVDEGVTTLWLTAGLFHLMVDEQLEGLSQVKQLLAGGDVLSVHHVEKYLAAIDGSERRLINGYGPTENTTFTCCHVMDGQTRLNGSVPIGRPITNTQVYVLDAEMQVAPVGVVGELYIGGVGLARGYFNQPELTAERFVPHPHGTVAGERLYRTGDMVRWHESGELEFIGRVDGQVKIRGFRIEVGELEAVLAAHSSVREVVVLVREDERGDKRLAAYVVKEVESEVSAGELKEYLRERLPEYMQVQWVVAVAELPLTGNGKVDRRALQALAVESGGEQRVAARTPTEEILAAIWGEVLGRETIGVHDDFFELGGHSLLATQVISRVRDAFGQEVALRSLFEQPTVAGLAREIEAGRGLGAELQAPPLERVERAERLPLSFAQQRLWFLDQLEPGSSFYNIPAAVRLRGVLNVAALERTLSEVVRRHEALRTHFIAIDGEPVQVIEAAAPLQLEVLDLSALDEAERTAETERLVNEESGRPFDLASGPLLRVGLLRLGKEEHVALVTMHHIVSDGWSMGLFIDEVATLYKAFTAGEESPLEELPIQYADFAHWQRGWLQGEVLAAQLDYWRAELADAPTVIELPSDKPRPPIQTYRGAYQPLQLSAELSAQLRELSRRHGSTLFMTLLAAFDLLLCRYAGQEQVLVGTPIANRNRSETEELIGFFVNTLVLRGDVRGNPSFSELLRGVRETALSAYAHQDLPFEKLVEELQPERDMSRSPLFQVMFVLQNAPGEALELEGLSLGRVGSAVETAKFELLLGLQEVGEEVAGSINYNRDLYEAETIGRLAASYERVLQAVVTDAEQRAWEIDLLSDAERQQVIQGWNATAREYAPALTLSELFEAQAARTPETVALGFEGTTLTYRELNERANQLARYLQCSGVGPDVLVGILMHRSVEMLVAVLGILKAGGAYVPLDPSYPGERLAFMVRDAGLRMLLTQEELLNEVPGEYVGQTLSLNQQWDAIAGESSANLPSSAQPEHVAYVIYTSGSTGRPKGVVVSHENVVRLLEATQPHFEFNQNDVWTLFHSYAFDFSVWEIWGALAYGGKLVIVPYWISRSAEAFYGLLVSEQVTVLNQTPSAFRQLIAADELAGEDVELKLRLVIFGGEALELQSLRPWFERHGDDTPRLVNMYGITETTVHVTYRPLSAADLELASSSVIGRPLECLQVYLLDGRGQPVPIGVPGEICVGGTGLARGYLNRAELTAERFVPNPFSTSPGARLYRSGDLARFLPNGDIDYLGRIDQQVKVRGFRIELGEIEAALAEHEAVRECTVVASPDANGEMKLLAYLVARQQPTPSVTALREFLQEKLPEYMIPASFTMLDAMPLTTNGKIDRKALPAPDQARPEMGKEFIAPRTPAEQIVAGIWEELLDVRPVGVRDDFFSLGGHSLLAVRLMARIQASFGQHLPLASLFQGATIEKLASLLHEQPHDHGASALVAIQPNGDGLPFFCVHPGGGNVLCYNELSNHLGFERPFYGLQARGLLENQIPHTRIEDMAAYYIDAIRTVRPDGPYLLGGWSMGGVIAYEMAQQLEGRGQQVSLLALMDARPVTSVDDAAPLDELTLLTSFVRDFGLPVNGLQLSTDELAKLDPDELLSHVLQRAIEAGVVPGDIQLAHARRLFEVFKINVQAMQSYRPEASSTRVTLLRAGEQEVADETMGWGALTSGEIEIHRVPGDHFTIVREPYVRSLAEQLADCINRATLRSLASHT